MPPSRDEKTEPPTPRRREEARKQGQVARSQDLTAAAMLLSAFLALWLLGPGIWQSVLAMTRASLRLDSIHVDETLVLGGAMAVEVIKRLAPFLLIVFIATLVALVAQVGLNFTLQPLMPNLGRINPIAGFRRLFSLKSVVLAMTNFGKLLVVAGLGYLTLVGGAAAVLFAFDLGHYELFRLGSSLVFDLGIRLSLALLVLALLDFAWQKHQHERDLRMTKEEVKDEFRSMEGDPQIKRRRREVQLRLATQRLRLDVPQADVILTNPTHVAVALRYDAETMAAPKVVAKGADQMAQRIRQIATEFRIPIVQRPPLARALYESVEPGDYVPERLYKAIAEILAYVYELTGKSPAKGSRQPAFV